MTKKPVRCAIYTRKSSEEGLEQSFNSLHAQRDACESYVRSQKHEGWIILKSHYDDGGFSGGNMDRPALQRLLADIVAGKIDTVVVYKIDRLTRSLLDFAKIVEAFDSKGVSFVSVTQQFNTTTSMGRLTLNILLSFAQFEREVTGERIRDKIAASKKKGMWMGGNVPLGYRVADRQLLIEPEAAKTVVEIFRQYLRLGCVSKLKAFLAAKGIHGSNDRILSRGALYHILNNRIYLGEIVHKKQIYPGQHKAIIDRVLWDKVVEKLKDNNPVPERNVRATESSLLAGLVFDVTGVRYTPTHAVKRGKRYRYYTSQSVIQRKEPAGIPRIPARDLEKVVETRIHALLTSPDELVKRLKAERVESLKTLAHQRTKEWGRLDAPSRMGLVKSLLTRVVVLTNSLEIEISHNALKNLLTGEAPKGDSGGDARTITCKCSIEVTNHAGSVQVISESAHTPQDEVRSLTLLKAFIRARQWHERIIRGEISSFQELGKEHGVTGRYIPRIFWTASLAPAIIESLVNGRPSHLSLETFRRRPPLDWQEQQARL